eukprot:jgi/Chrzof1/4268/Cz14g05180.t1
MLCFYSQVFPAAERNKEPILAVLRQHLPASGFVLEVASGSGQHVAHFAQAFPGITWLPSDITSDLFMSISAHCSGLPNTNHPVVLDVSSSKWPLTEPCDAIIATNLTHVSPWEATTGLLDGAARHLKPGGLLLIYGPFKLDGVFTTASNAEFDESLRVHNPLWGYRDTADVTAAAQQRGLQQKQPPLPMPANNFILMYSKL